MRRFHMSRSRNAARRAQQDLRQVEEMMTLPSGGGRRTSVGGIKMCKIAGTRTRRACATIQVRGARTGFYDPAAVLLKQLEETAEEEAQTSEGRRLDPSKVRATAPDVAGTSHSTGQEAFWRLAHHRMRSIVGGEECLRSWRAGHVRAGFFFMFADRVLLVEHHHATGWRHLVVPPVGIETREGRRP
jgi:hypothetical protein